MKYPATLFLSLLILLGQACNQKPRYGLQVLDGGNIITEGTRLIDSYGRQVILKGLNRVNKDPGENYIDKDTSGVFDRFSHWGFNCIRLGIIWDGVEPDPGKYDESYLDKVEEQVNLAAQNGLHVLLDMHQDLYGVSFHGTSMGDGAPEWATITENQPHVTGDIWSDSYLLSPAVQKAFDNFWANTPAIDGTGIQDHYAKMWQHVVRRFSGNKAIIGYDIMNEPFNGTQGIRLLPLILKEYATLYAEETGKVLSEKEVLEMWSGGERRFEAISRLNDPEKYARVMDAAGELNRQFEKSSLQPMYQRVCNAIREVDSVHILFLEHSYFGNTGISSSIEPVRDRHGNADPLVVYAAHGYDLLVDTKNYDNQSSSRVELIFSRINETSRRLNIPVLVGEWGAFSGNSQALAESANFIEGLFDRYGFSNTYWCYYPGIGNDLYFRSALVRPYPPCIGGRLDSYRFDPVTGLFSCSWKESDQVKAPTVIFIPDLENLATNSILLSPGGKNFEILPMENSKAGYLIIPVTGESSGRTVEFRLNRDSEPIK